MYACEREMLLGTIFHNGGSRVFPANRPRITIRISCML